MFSLFGLTFSGLPAAAAAGIAAAGTAAVVALYLLRERERRVRVAFVPLWEMAGGKRRIERLGRRLRRWLSLLLQLVLLWLLLLALVDPRPAASGAGGRSWVVLVDRSVSMGARLDGVSRIEQARRRVREIIAAMTRDDRIMVASFGREVTVESGFESDEGRLLGAVDRLEPADEGADLGRALAFASAVLRGRPRPTVVVVGDGRFDEGPPGDEPGATGGIELRWSPVGAPGDNLAITSLTARRRPLDPATVEIAVVVQSHSRQRQTVAVEILAGAEKRVLERISLTLEPGGRAARTISQLSTRRAELEARLVAPEGGGTAGGAAGSPAPPTDLLAADDRAFTVVPERARRRVLVLGASNLYLEGALLSFGDSLAVERASAAQAEGLRARWPEYDAVIFDGVAPAPLPEAGRYLYFDPQGPGSPWAERGIVRDPVPSDGDRSHPLVAQLALTDLNIREARRLAPAPGDQTAAASFGVPLVLARSRPGLRMVGVSFDPRRSDLPLRATFPLLLANVLDWLDRGGEEAAATYRTGTVVPVPVDGAPEVATVVGPRGEVRRMAVAGSGSGAASVDVLLDRAGFHRVSGGRVLAANVVEAGESDLREAPRWTHAGRTQAAWTTPPAARRTSWGRLALVVALLLSLVEWWSYHRRWTI